MVTSFKLYLFVIFSATRANIIADMKLNLIIVVFKTCLDELNDMRIIIKNNTKAKANVKKMSLIIERYSKVSNFKRSILAFALSFLNLEEFAIRSYSSALLQRYLFCGCNT